MANRNRTDAKAQRRARNSVVKPLPAYIDLVQWIKDRQRVSTGLAMKIISAGALKVDSHPLTERYVPAEFRDRITVVEPPKND